MFIKDVIIHNFRNFKVCKTELKPFSILIGENDIGKSNFLQALSLPLNSNDFQHRSKTLKTSDINSVALNDFIDLIKKDNVKIKKDIENENDISYVIEKIPIVEVYISFSNPETPAERALLKDWLDENEKGEIIYSIKYQFKPQNNNDLIDYVLTANDENQLSEFNYPINLYDYQIESSNNNKRITFRKLRNFNINIINAERDTFSESSHRKSNKLVSDLLERNMDSSDKNDIHKAYIDFFNTIDKAKSFKEAFKHLDEAEYINASKYIETMKLVPNFPNLKNIFSNISVGYGSEFLHQRGLGTRNFVLMMLLFSYYHSNDENFNIVSIEEPESHLCVNNFNLILDYIEKSVQSKNSLTQIILTSHNPKVINKLKFNNVIVLKQPDSVSFSEVPSNLVTYLSKRPNFDTLKLLFANKAILVEGPTEEMLINSMLSIKKDYLSEIEVISVGHKGFRTYLDIWLKINKDNQKKRIGIIRDYDNQPKAQKDHEKYESENSNICVRTTKNYTLEDELVKMKDNCRLISNFFSIDDDPNVVITFLKEYKAMNMYNLSLAIAEKDITLACPSHIQEVIDWILK